MSPPHTLRGSCLCQRIRYEITSPLGRIVNCHCSTCRKATGAAFRTRASVRGGGVSLAER
jgi:hypothetical protein